MQLSNIPNYKGFLIHSKSRVYLEKLKYSQDILAESLLKVDKPYIAFSTGKDSSVACDMALKMDANIDVVYFDANCGFPDTYRILDKFKAEGKHVVIRETKDWFDIVRDAGGYGTQNLEYITMQETVVKPIKEMVEELGYDSMIVGLRAEESIGRRAFANVYGHHHHSKKYGIVHINPLLKWRYMDIWAYIVSNAIDYNKTYDLLWNAPETSQRISYWAGESNMGDGRWVWLRINFPQLYYKLLAFYPQANGLT